MSRDEDREKFIEALCAPGLADIVDLVCWVEDGEGGPTAYAANSVGRVRLHPDRPREVVSGQDPIGSEDPLAFLPYERELADPSPARSTHNAYPLAATRLLSFFADPDRSPDLAVVHTPRHFFPEEGGHVGEHGSLDVIQSRAPFILSGAGVRRQGYVDAYARLVDVGPTLAHLAGVPEDDLRDAKGEALDGRPQLQYLQPGTRPSHVIGILWDGAHCSDLLHLAETGELPGVARLVERGVALRGGAVAEFPSITLTNHTAILTGIGPGRHGVMGNVYYDRATGERVVPNDESTWHRSAEWLHPAARTIFEMVGDHLPADAAPRTASIDEAIDRGADYSTMAVIRASGESGADALDDALPDPHSSAFVRNRDYLADRYFRWCLRVDDLGLQQVLDLWADPALAPRLTWWANIVTDGGHHGGGPRSEMARDSLRQSDARLSVFLDQLERLGVLDDVTILLTADHGFETSSPEVTGSWRPALDALGIPYRDEGPGFVYLL
ncbi:MAG TPA: alkaline phosphatase family protein [Nocardioides sp.]|uniref:alkaline phosphatase family protein n=1 Tax=Nocardioides sp. TaxID=35761 RepID=UPI002D12F206|nr:alkaline phosphatase family protein [Nocardioides sp.]HQR26072.1 alkaline phosphatase family protein [Nocardioides sp.]